MAAIGGFLYLLLLLLAVPPSSSTVERLSFVVGESTELHIVPNVTVINSPGSKPGIHILAERVHIQGLPRLKNLRKFSHALSVKISHLNSSHRLPNAEVCFHRNLSLAVGMCPQSQWQKLSKGSWSQKMSPFDHKLIDVRMAGSSMGALKLTLEEEFSAYRIVFLVLGTLFLTLASAFSESLIFYYSSAMIVGIILVILLVLFQGMKLLPTGRGSSLAIFLYSSLLISRSYVLVGVGSFLLRYLPSLLRTMLAEMGISEDMYNPLAIFIVLFISLGGAWLGFWVVRKLILTEDGSIDTTVSQFVAWSIRILGAVMILQCSLDPLVAAEALVSSIFMSSILRKAIRPRLARRLYRKLQSPGRSSRQKSTDGKRAEHAKTSQYAQDQFISPQSRWTSPAYSPVKGLVEKQSLPPSEPEIFYSTFHKTPDRRKFTSEEWKAFTKDCTKRGLEELVSSPEFGRWAVAHAERITLAPIENQPTSRWHKWLSWFR